LKGNLKGRYISVEAKGALVDIITKVKETSSVSVKYCCDIVELDIKRYQRWLRLYRDKGRYGDGKPGPKKPPHGLMAEERKKIVDLARDDKYLDLSHRQLAITASEKEEVEASPSSFYRIMKEEKLMEKRERIPKTPQKRPEVKPQGSNEIWSWDLTYISLGPLFVYLFAIIDVFSRKIVGWHLSFNATVDSMKIAWDNALSNEGLLDIIGAPKMPLALSDHGVQMAKKSAKQFFKDLGVKQLFARYQTPKDNAWIESWFRILKYDWLRYKDCVSFSQLKGIIGEFIYIYNHQRYHGSIDYVTPEQKHTGQADNIIKARAERKRQARQKRIEFNRSQNCLYEDFYRQVGQTEWAQAA
jgi:transposase InsO family protein